MNRGKCRNLPAKCVGFLKLNLDVFFECLKASLNKITDKLSIVLS